MERIKLNIYNPEKLTKHMINDLIDKGIRFDIIPGLEEEEYSEIDLKEAVDSGRKSKESVSIIGTIF